MLLRVVLLCCIVAIAMAANLKGSNNSDKKIMKKLKSQGYKPIGGGYWQKSFDYFFANGAHDPKLWIKIGDVAGNVKSLGAGYAADSFNGYFRGKKLDISGNLKVLKANGKLTWYAVDSFNAFYQGKQIETSGTLKALGFKYARDSFNSYYAGKEMKDSSGKLKVTKCGFAYDSFNVYYAGKQLENANGKMKCVGGGYAEDSSGNKFYKGKEVDSSSISHFNKKEFKHIGGGYALSGADAFFDGKRFDAAGPGRRANGLQVLKGPKGKFSNWAKSALGNLYYKGERQTGLVGQDITLLGNGWAQAGHKTFYKGESTRVVGKLSVHGNGYATDQFNGFYKGEKINLMGQAGSFKLIGNDYAGTQLFAYYKGEKVQGCTKPMKVFGEGYLACLGSVFYHGERVQGCVNPQKSLGHGYLQCQLSYVYKGEKVRHAQPTLNPLTVSKDGEVADRRGNKYVNGERD